MKWIFFLLIAISFQLSAISMAGAQVIVVDANKAVLSWTWTQGAGDPATGFRAKCGPGTNNYNKVTDLPITPLSVALSKVIGGSGTYYCVVVAFNPAGDSPPSNEVTFFAGTAPFGSLVLSPPK